MKGHCLLSTDRGHVIRGPCMRRRYQKAIQQLTREAEQAQAAFARERAELQVAGGTGTRLGPC